MDLSSIHLVRARCPRTGGDYFAAHEGFVAVLPEDGLLHHSRARFAVRQFPDAASADEFAQDYALSHPGRFTRIEAEPASPEFIAAIPSLETDRAVLVQNLTRLVPAVLDAFDFERVAKAMAALDWKCAGDDVTPTTAQLRKMAEGLLLSAVDDDGASVSTSGGFRAWAFGEKLYLQFVIETAFAEPGRASRL